MSKQAPSAPTASAVGHCPTVHQIVGCLGTGSLPSTIAPPDHPLTNMAAMPTYAPVPGRPTIWMIVGQGPNALAVGADGGCLDIFTLHYPFSHLLPLSGGTARYRLKYCLKGPLNQKQTKPNPYMLKTLKKTSSTEPMDR